MLLHHRINREIRDTMNMRDTDLLNDFQKRRNLKASSMRQYQTTLRKYADYNKMSLHELLMEAEHEEDQRIPQRRRTLTTRLLDFRNHITQHYKKNYVKSTMTKVITLYTTYGLEIPKLPLQSGKNMNEPTPISFKDLPDKDIIEASLKITTPLMKAIILFMSSSGCARTETLNITIQDFIEATKNYHNSNDIYEVMDTLKQSDDIVPTFRLKRQKTDKWYYTFCSPEAVSAILDYLVSIKKPLQPTDKLFQYHEVTVCYKFQEINNELGLGKKGTYNRFRSHMLRKFHASNLKNNGMAKEDINAMQGKGQNQVDEAYFFDDPNILREKYISHLDCLVIDTSRRVKTELEQVTEENKELRKRDEQLNSILDRLARLEKR